MLFRSGMPVPLNALLALNILRNSRRMTVNEISEATHIPIVKLHATLEYLTENGLVEALGNGRGRNYVLSAKSYQNPVKYVRQTDIDRIRYQELVYKLAKKKKTIMRKDVVELLHVSPSQAYRLLQKMVDDEELVREGTTS